MFVLNFYVQIEKAHANIQKVWQDERIFGTGITFLVIDDGVNVDHPDLASNYAGAALSYNYERNNNYIQASGGTVRYFGFFCEFFLKKSNS